MTLRYPRRAYSYGQYKLEVCEYFKYTGILIVILWNLKVAFEFLVLTTRDAVFILRRISLLVMQALIFDTVRKFRGFFISRNLTKQEKVVRYSMLVLDLLNLHV